MTKLSFLMCFFIFSKAMAMHVSIFPLNPEQRVVENQNKELRLISVKNYAFSLSKDLHQVLLEHAELETNSGNETLSITEISQEYHIAYLHEIYSWQHYWSLHLGLGTGQYTSTIKTQYLNNVSEETSGSTLLFSGISSIQFQYQYFHTQLDFKLIQAKDYNPQPQPTFILRAGLSF